MRLKVLLFLSIICVTSFGQPLFKSNDKVCFMGNSITHGGRYHSYIYLFYATRFPELRLSFTNCGISGDVASGMYSRLQRDIYDNLATVATLSAGMNDVNRGLYSTKKPVENAEQKKREAIENYQKNVIRIAESYRENHLKSIFFTPTIYDESDSIASENMKGVNAALGECRDFVWNLGKEYNATVVDFWKPMTELNARMQQTNPSFTLIGKDRIHPQATGHLVMAYLFLTQTNAPKEVWTLSIDAKNKTTVSQRNCNLSSLIIKPNRLTFKNKEFALPFPSIESAKEAFRLVPFIDSLNQQVLQIHSCDSGHYRLKINNMEVGTYSSADFEKGINLAINTKTPQYALSDSIAKLCEEHFSKGSTLRTLRRVEIKQLSKLNIDDKAAVTAYLNRFIDEMRLQKNNPEANSGYYIMTAQTYLKDKPNEEAFKKRISEIEGLIYSLNKPQTYTYVIEKIRN